MQGRTRPVWRGTNLARIGDFNEAVLIDTIRRSPNGVSRVELVEATGLSPQTISNIVRRMIDARMIVEGERLRDGGMGKPRTLLRLDPTGAYAVGVHLDPRVMTFVLLNLHGHVIRHMSRATPTAAAPDDVLAQVHEAVRSLVDDAGIERTRLTGIGFASPGPIDVERGIVLDPPHLPGWRNVPLRDHHPTHRTTGTPRQGRRRRRRRRAVGRSIARLPHVGLPLPRHGHRYGRRGRRLRGPRRLRQRR